METIRIGFVGLGGIARQRHVPGLRKIEGVEIVAVANRSRESSERAASEFGIPAVCDTWEEVVARDDVDAVFVGTWPYMHCPISVAALEAGKHVFTQARMAMNYPEAARMLEAAAKSGLVAMICPVPYGLSVDVTVKRLLREGYIGDMRFARVTSFSDAYASADAPMNWRKDERLSGLNAMTLGMFIEVMHRWFGMTKSVAAQTQTFVQTRVDGEGNRREVKIPDQIIVEAEMRQPRNEKETFPVQYTFSSVVRHPADLIELFGSAGSLRYEVGPDRLLGARNGEMFAPVPIPPEESYDVQNWRVEQDFIDAIRYGSEYHPNFEDGAMYMRVIQAVYDSAARRSAL